MNALAGTPASGTYEVKSEEWKVKNGCCGHEYHKHVFFRQSFLTKKSKILKQMRSICWCLAEVVELVDTHVSGACVRKDMGVRVPPSAQKKMMM